MSEQLDNNMSPEFIEINDKVCLRPLRFDEAEYMFSVVDANREYLRRWLPWVDATQSPEDTLQFIERTTESRKNGNEYGFAIEFDGKPAGHISLMHLAVEDERDPEIGYWIASEISGKGITTKTAGALTRFGFEILKLPKIIIRADQENIASNKVAEKLGYQIERTEHIDFSNSTGNVWAKYSN